MSKEKIKKFYHGGARRNSGRKKGSGLKRKICVSVNEENWQAALSRWSDKGSRLVDRLLSHYLEKGESDLELRAAT
jgi:hypothetical protein